MSGDVLLEILDKLSEDIALWNIISQDEAFTTKIREKI